MVEALPFLTPVKSRALTHAERYEARCTQKELIAQQQALRALADGRPGTAPPSPRQRVDQDLSDDRSTTTSEPGGQEFQVAGGLPSRLLQVARPSIASVSGAGTSGAGPSTSAAGVGAVVTADTQPQPASAAGEQPDLRRGLVPTKASSEGEDDPPRPPPVPPPSLGAVEDPASAVFDISDGAMQNNSAWDPPRYDGAPGAFRTYRQRIKGYKATVVLFGQLNKVEAVLKRFFTIFTGKIMQPKPGKDGASEEERGEVTVFATWCEEHAEEIEADHLAAWVAAGKAEADYQGAAFKKPDGTSVPDLWDFFLDRAAAQYDIADPKAKEAMVSFKQHTNEAPHTASERYKALAARLQEGTVSQHDLARWFWHGLHDERMKNYISEEFVRSIGGNSRSKGWTLDFVVASANHYYANSMLSFTAAEEQASRRKSERVLSTTEQAGSDGLAKQMRDMQAQLLQLSTAMTALAQRASPAAGTSSSRPPQQSQRQADNRSDQRSKAGGHGNGSSGNGGSSGGSGRGDRHKLSEPGPITGSLPPCDYPGCEGNRATHSRDFCFAAQRAGEHTANKRPPPPPRRRQSTTLATCGVEDVEAADYATTMVSRPVGLERAQITVIVQRPQLRGGAPPSGLAPSGTALGSASWGGTSAVGAAFGDSAPAAPAVATSLVITAADQRRQQQAAADQAGDCAAPAAARTAPPGLADAGWTSTSLAGREAFPQGFAQLQPALLPTQARALQPRGVNGVLRLSVLGPDGLVREVELGAHAPRELQAQWPQFLEAFLRVATAPTQQSTEEPAQAAPPSPCPTAAPAGDAAETPEQVPCAAEISDQQVGGASSVAGAAGGPVVSALAAAAPTPSSGGGAEQPVAVTAGSSWYPQHPDADPAVVTVGAQAPLGQVQLHLVHLPGTPWQVETTSVFIVVSEATADACGFSVLLGTDLLHRLHMNAERFPVPHCRVWPEDAQEPPAYLSMEPLEESQALCARGLLASLGATATVLMTRGVGDNPEIMEADKEQGFGAEEGEEYLDAELLDEGDPDQPGSGQAPPSGPPPQHQGERRGGRQRIPAPPPGGPSHEAVDRQAAGGQHRSRALQHRGVNPAPAEDGGARHGDSRGPTLSREGPSGSRAPAPAAQGTGGLSSDLRARLQFPPNLYMDEELPPDWAFEHLHPAIPVNREGVTDTGVSRQVHRIRQTLASIGVYTLDDVLRRAREGEARKRAEAARREAEAAVQRRRQQEAARREQEATGQRGATEGYRGQREGSDQRQREAAEQPVRGVLRRTSCSPQPRSPPRGVWSPPRRYHSPADRHRRRSPVPDDRGRRLSRPRSPSHVRRSYSTSSEEDWRARGRSRSRTRSAGYRHDQSVGRGTSRAPSQDRPRPQAHRVTFASDTPSSTWPPRGAPVYHVRTHGLTSGQDRPHVTMPVLDCGREPGQLEARLVHQAGVSAGPTMVLSARTVGIDTGFFGSVAVNTRWLVRRQHPFSRRPVAMYDYQLRPSESAGSIADSELHLRLGERWIVVHPDSARPWPVTGDQYCDIRGLCERPP
ncbi:hypothetical protein PLESTF_001187500 [Pleodorina starrii]|nr:hypothetical protein PLESTF_001187500 [Pleodorina starrii]